MENTDEIDFTDYIDEDTDKIENINIIKNMKSSKYVENIVDSTDIKNVVISTSKSYHKQVAEELKNLTTKVAPTMNTWILSANQAYIAITIYYIDDK
ncbi:10530_t:CDS:2 [Dentiscutata erythropus]|uniref:10530_t:CDS:1 n=1 Tax=Dentiscutata erythropus TaxID=1348616 RepID=A0A9N9IHQ7_9GLOM|nr:10530_t:CDS:2 [Dentiscutata erythropus]